MAKQTPNPAEALTILKARIDEVDSQHRSLLAQRKAQDDSLGSVLSAGGDIVAAENRIVALDIDINRNRRLRTHLVENEMPPLEREALSFEFDEANKAATAAEAAKVAHGKKLAQLWDDYRKAEVVHNNLCTDLDVQSNRGATAQIRLMQHREAHPALWADYDGPCAALWAGYEQLTGYVKPERKDDNAA